MSLVFSLDVEPPPLWSHPPFWKGTTLTGKTPSETLSPPCLRSQDACPSHLCSSSSHTLPSHYFSLIWQSHSWLWALAHPLKHSSSPWLPIWEPLWFLIKIQKKSPATWEANTCILLIMRNHLLCFFQPLTSSREPDISEPDFMTFRPQWPSAARPWCGRCLGF